MKESAKILKLAFIVIAFLSALTAGNIKSGYSWDMFGKTDESNPATEISQDKNTSRIPQSNAEIKLSFAPLVKKIEPAVVSISSQRVITTGYRHPFIDDPFFAPFFGNRFLGKGGLSRQRVESSLGSGLIVSPEGLVVTNAHVIDGASEVKIILPDEKEMDTETILIDKASDIALLQIKAENEDIVFPYATFKPSEELEVGDLVLAIGNPFGVGQTVTSGIVSALARSSLGINDYNFFIQTDAAINPGNSGGPLVAMDGNVVGINTAIYSRNGGNIGIGFAIPSETVQSVIRAKKAGNINDSGIVRSWLGITGQKPDSDLAKSLELDSPHGVLITSVHSASPLKIAGIKTGDVITAVNGKQVRDPAEMNFRWSQTEPGEQTDITFYRKGKNHTVTITAILPPDEPPADTTLLEGGHLLNGATIANINPAIAFNLGILEESGVVVTDTKNTSRASQIVNKGDILKNINGKDIKNVKDAVKILNKSGNSIDLTIQKDGKTKRIVIRM